MEENGKSGISAEIWPISSGHDDDKQLDNITVTVIDPNIVMIDDKMEKKLELENGKVEMEKKDSYIVEKGDTLIGISMKLNISVARLKKYNHLFGKNDVIVGQVLRLTEKPEVYEKPFISLKDSKINSSFRERENLKHQSSAFPVPKKTENNRVTPLQISELDDQPPLSMAPTTSSTAPSSLSSFRYKAISDPNLCLHIEDEIHIFPRRRSIWNFEREREDAISATSDDDFVYLDFELTEEERAILDEVPDIPGLDLTQKSNSLQSSLKSSPAQVRSLTPTLSGIPNSLQRLRTVTRQVAVPLNIDIGSINSQILTHSHIQALLRHLPLFLQTDGWKLLYSILLYGDDLSSFYQFAGVSKYSLVVVKSKDGQIFGGFGTEPWRLQKTHMFYGTGESFVFMIHVNDDSVEVFDWKYSNYFFQWSSSEQIAMGGGGGQFGFVLGNDLLQGETNPCETFGNPYLTTHRGVFDILEVEVWGFESYCR